MFDGSPTICSKPCGTVNMNVLILGSGAREHALAVAIAGSPMLGRLFVAPGNPGCEAVANLSALTGRAAAIIRFCIEQKVGLSSLDLRRP